MMKEIRYKIIIRAFSNGPWSSIIERPITAISWDLKPKKPFWVARMAYGSSKDSKPLLFSAKSAEAVVSQIARFRFAGPGPDGLATARTVPVEVGK